MFHLRYSHDCGFVFLQRALPPKVSDTVIKPNNATLSVHRASPLKTLTTPTFSDLNRLVSAQHATAEEEEGKG